jgi:aryl-alcohol dehydrogenase-like predicted oxidoreductase
MKFGSRMPPISTLDREGAEAMLERALDAGVNLVDTADAYSGGESEEMLAPFLTRHRDELVIATKLGWGLGAGANVVTVLRRIAEELDTTPASVAIAWLLSRPEVTSVIVGASTLAQLEENLVAIDLKMDEGQLAALTNLSAIPSIYPRWWDTAMGIA